MPEKILSTDPPDIDCHDFEDYIATDELFVDYFNAFLALPSFPEPLRFNSESGGFEVLTSAKHDIAQKIKTAAREKKIDQLTRKEWLAEHARNMLKKKDASDEEEIKTHFSVKCLDKEQGIQWIKEERLPLFLQSELYMEYRLSKLLSQVETSPGGMKLTVDHDFRPWYKPRVVQTPPPPIDETEEMIRRMFVTLGETQRTQTESWATSAKMAEVQSTTITTSRPLSSAAERTASWTNSHNAARPLSIQGARTTIGAGDMDFLSDDKLWKEEPNKKANTTRPKKVTVIAPSETSGGKSSSGGSRSATPIQITSSDAACSIQYPTGTVAKVEQTYSDSEWESDQGMGSDSESTKTTSESARSAEESSSTKKDFSLELRTLDDYASVFVALAIKNSVTSLNDGLTSETLDGADVFQSLIPESEGWKLGLRDAKAPMPISRLNEKVFAEAILEQERRILNETGRSSRKSLRHKALKKSRDVSCYSTEGRELMDLLKVDSDKADTKTEDFLSNVSESSEEDSVFSEQSDDLYSTSDSKDHLYDFVDVKGFSKFMKFVGGTIGENLVQLWLDIDKLRFALTKDKKIMLINKMRLTYLSVNSGKKIKREMLAKWDLDSASNWTISKLIATQRPLVEPILLYWGPQFLIHQCNKIPQSPRPQKENLTVREKMQNKIRPISSQSHPAPKTITILPLRPKSCLPRLKMKEPIETSTTEEVRNHVMPPFQQIKFHPKFQHQMFHQLKFNKKPLSANMLRALARNDEAVAQKSRHEKPMSKYLAKLLNKGKRATSAGPLTQGNLAIFEQKKKRVSSAVTATRSLPATFSRAKRSLADGSVTSLATASSSGSRFTIRGSDYMESMLQALYYDTKAGWYFTLYCENSGNQEYHHKFYCQIFNEFAVKRMAKIIFARFIVQASPEDIGVSRKLRNAIHASLDPPFDELFDEAEEYILKILIDPWNKMLSEDRENYKKVEMIEHERNLQIGSKYTSILQTKSFKRVIPVIQTDIEAAEKYEENLWDKVPEEYRGFTFDELVRNRIELEHFKKFLEENYASTDILCWLDIQFFIRLPHQANEKRDQKAKEIKSKYLHKKYFFGPSSPATKEEQNLVVKAGGGWGMTLKERPPTDMIIESQKYVRKRLENRWLPRFLATSAFHTRQRPQSHMSEVAEDVVLQRRKKRGEPWKHLDNRWQSSSEEIREFRKALLNKVTASQFRRYVSLKGDLLENDVLFWTEVQKYKDFCHIHNEPAAVEVKVSAIINCFISSQIPPALQIDVPQECADKIMEKRRELGPYVFREAQLTVFRVLFPYWNDFCKFRENLSEEKLTTTLQRRAQRRMLQVKKQLNQHHLEELAKEEAREKEEAAVAQTNQEMASLRDSDEIAESVMSMQVQSNTLKWSYGKYVEGIDKERMLLMMENEVRGRVPPEPLPERDVDVSSDESENLASDDEVTSGSSIVSASGRRKKKKKKKKDKIILSSVRNADDVSDKVSEEKPDTKVVNGTKSNPPATTGGKNKQASLEEADTKKPVVSVD